MKYDRPIRPEYLALAEGLTMISLIYAPLPFLSGTGYSGPAIVASVALGVALSLFVLLTGVMRQVSLRVHILAVSVLAIGLFVASGVALRSELIPRLAFGIYAILLLAGAGLTGIPSAERKRSSRDALPFAETPSQPRREAA